MHLVLAGIDEPLLSEVVRLKEHQVHQRVGLTHVSVARDYDELAIFKTQVLV